MSLVHSVAHCAYGGAVGAAGRRGHVGLEGGEHGDDGKRVVSWVFGVLFVGVAKGHSSGERVAVAVNLVVERARGSGVEWNEESLRRARSSSSRVAVKLSEPRDLEGCVIAVGRQVARGGDRVGAVDCLRSRSLIEIESQ